MINILRHARRLGRREGRRPSAPRLAQDPAGSRRLVQRGRPDGANTNSTGLAGWALAEAGQARPRRRLPRGCAALQVADLAPCATTLAADNGAIALTHALTWPRPRTPVRSARSASLTVAGATAQALPALALRPGRRRRVTLSAPATAVEKSTVTVTVTGPVPVSPPA